MNEIERQILGRFASLQGVIPRQAVSRDLPNGRLFGFIAEDGRIFLATAEVTRKGEPLYASSWVDEVSGKIDPQTTKLRIENWSPLSHSPRLWTGA